jgi:2-polyprenyl-3-methyl-5-hydroxy-6-metoxy-1,4-benzoquinol methylase
MGADQRIQHSPFFVLLLGGALGSSLNFIASSWLYWRLAWSPFPSFFAGTLLNLLFHHVYYYVINANREIRMRTPLPLQGLLYVAAAAASTGLLWFFLRPLGMSFPLGVVCSIGVLSALSLLVIRPSTFSTAELARVDYQQLDGNYYDEQTDPTKVSRFRAWYHRSRYERLGQLVSQHYRPGMRVADLGCGNCWWNTFKAPVTGVDINERMLQWARRNERLADYRVTSNLAQTSLPSETFDIVITSETLEHILNLDQTLAEVRRILKPEGKYLITVPYDLFLGPFFILFNLNCIYMGYLRGSHYHRVRCGHINHFTKRRLRTTLARNGFTLKQVWVVNGLLLYAVAERITN